MDGLNTFECNYLTPLHLNGLTRLCFVDRKAAQAASWWYDWWRCRREWCSGTWTRLLQRPVTSCTITVSSRAEEIRPAAGDFYITLTACKPMTCSWSTTASNVNHEYSSAWVMAIKSVIGPWWWTVTFYCHCWWMIHIYQLTVNSASVNFNRLFATNI